MLFFILLYCKIFITHHPCNECAKAIVQSGISEVIYDDSKDSKESEVAKIILRNAGVKMIKYTTELECVKIEF